MLNNLGVKIGAFVVALLVWLHVVTEKTYTHTFQATINPVHLKKDLVIANTLPRHVEAKIQGKGKYLLWLMFSERTVTLDLNNAVPQKTRYRFVSGDVAVPRDLDVTVVELGEPDYVDVDIDRVTVKKIPVIPNLAVETASGYIVSGPVRCSPDSAVLSGPERFVAHVDTLYNRAVSIDHARDPVVRELSIELPPGTHVIVSPALISAEVDIQKLRQRVIEDVPVTLTNAPPGLKVRLDESFITLTVEGGEQTIASLSSDDFHVAVDYRQALRDSARVAPPSVRTPAHVKWIDAKPQTFRVLHPRS